MNSESESDADYSYSEPPPLYAPSGPSIQLPFALLTCAIAMFMVMQTQAVFRQKSALQEGKAQLVEAFAKREPLVKTTGELKGKLEALVRDLLILGKTDEDAKAIIAKYGIRQDLPGSATEAEAPK